MLTSNLEQKYEISNSPREVGHEAVVGFVVDDVFQHQIWVPHLQGFQARSVAVRVNSPQVFLGCRKQYKLSTSIYYFHTK